MYVSIWSIALSNFTNILHSKNSHCYQTHTHIHAFITLHHIMQTDFCKNEALRSFHLRQVK
uniref:Uncharacterized protein n=1 Tax=Octopus bimaculoides TaxID=37653 RepID=A0A0L8HP46_OCTBM